MVRVSPGCGRRYRFARGKEGLSHRQTVTHFARPDILQKARFRDLISGACPVNDRRNPIIACYTRPQEACVATLRSRSLKQTGRNLYRARPVSDSRGRRLGTGVGR